MTHDKLTAGVKSKYGNDDKFSEIQTSGLNITMNQCNIHVESLVMELILEQLDSLCTIRKLDHNEKGNKNAM